MSNDTSCKACVFAEYDDMTQVGCSRGMLKKYKDVGANVVEAYDEDREFMVIENRLCPFYRTKGWIDRIPEEDFDATVERMLALETRLSFHAIVFVEDHNIESVCSTIDSLYAQNNRPARVTVVRPRTSTIKPRDIRELFNEDCGFKWRIENLIGPTPRDVVTHSVHKKSGRVQPCQYYAVVDAGHVFDEQYFYEINEAIIGSLLQFAMIESKECIVIPNPVHQYWHFHGNHEITIAENIREYQCKNKEKKVVLKMSQVQGLLTQKS